jgi:small ligand-binding sensory domain FIST
MKKLYPAVFRKDEDGSFWVEFPDLPGCLTDGATLDLAMKNAEGVPAISLPLGNGVSADYFIVHVDSFQSTFNNWICATREDR